MLCLPFELLPVVKIMGIEIDAIFDSRKKNLLNAKD